MKRNRYLIIGILLFAAIGFIMLQTRIAPAVENATSTPSITNTVTISFTDTPTPTLTPSYEGCGYMWAYHDAPELTEKINAAVRSLNPDAGARAELFGEDCVYADGHSTFGAMETDFHIQLSVDDLTDEEAFGNFVAQVMPVIIQIPREEIQGNYGFVEFLFTKSEMERIIFRVPIDKYINEAGGKSGAELFRFFYIPPVNPT